MSRASGRLVVVLSGGTLVALAGAAALRWKDIAAEYHLYLLEKDPGYFLKASAAPEGSPRREAAQRFITREGSFQRVLRALKEANEGQPAQAEGSPSAGRAFLLDGDLRDTTAKEE